ncbi:hypothetical protein BJY01DRAFT_238021 [Aspergillus pseudoustus]|uniref:DNA mismatch repair protein S5 domain-containing protein n=1 Tax=Aspergillus pseudoustus TaxID=1810923 RepID=A0ABR4JAI0_9EURO
MPIEALPPTTARAIGSTSTISDPCSTIKELLDNALDASASSVSIEISQDTINLIQVKDNGHGIPGDDYGVVCKRGCTSKIRTVEDLRNVGGISLGFRGEALASAAEVSGGLMVTTRVKSEAVGSCLKYGRDGELLSAERIPHPVGTTVRITDLFKHIPVRRQTSIKDAKKTIMKVRKMVQAYAMARPTTRLSLKIAKAKSTSGNWVYAPGRDATPMEAAMQVIGTEVASMCVSIEWPTIPQGETQAQSNSSLRLIALLPKPSSDFAPLKNKGHYISVDGRPMASGRGIAQDIMKLYKSHLRTASSAKSSQTITDPFLCLHLKCPGGIYDVNVEPLKDDVLFEDKTVVLSLVENLLRESYGGPSSPKASIPASDSRHASPDPNTFPTLLPAVLIESTLSPPASGALSTSPSVNTPFTRPQLPQQTSPGAQSTFARRSEAIQRSRGIPPPDIMSPINASGQPSPSTSSRNEMITRIFPYSGQVSTPQRARRAFQSSPSLPSPVSTRSSPPSNINTRSPLVSRPAFPTTGQVDLSPTTPVQGQNRQRQRESERTLHGNGTIDSWFQRVTQAAYSSPTTQNAPNDTDEPPLSVLAQQRFGECVSPPSASGLSPNESQSPNNSSASESPQASSPTQDTPLIRGMNRHKGQPVLEQWSAKVYADHNSYQNLELQKALDFEIRKKAAIQQKRSQLQQARSSGNSSSPHRNRYISARAALASEPQPQVHLEGQEDTTRITPGPVLNPHDPRAYLKRLLETESTDPANSSKLRRFGSIKLPFEKIPAGQDLHDVSIRCPTDLLWFSKAFRHTFKDDVYAQTGYQVGAFTNLDDCDFEFWTERLTAMVKIQYNANEDSAIPKLQFDFSQMI